MSLYKRGQVWWMSFVYKGQRVRKSTEVTNKKLAGKIFNKVMTEIAEGKWLDRLPGEEKSFREMMEKYVEEHSRPRKTYSVRDGFSLTHLLPYFGDTMVSDITPRMINEFKAHRRSQGVGPGTINRELALMKHAFNLALREWGWVNENPVVKVSMEKEPPSRDRWLDYEEEERLLAHSASWLRPLIVFAVETGCRRGEQFSLRWRDVDLQKKVVRIFGSKTGDRRVVPLTERALGVLKEIKSEKVRSLEDLIFTHPPGHRVNNYTLRSAFLMAKERVGLSDFRWHDLRHTFASRLAQVGVDPYTIQRLMGHRTFATTQRYAHHHVESLRRGINVFEASRMKMQDNFGDVGTTVAQFSHN